MQAPSRAGYCTGNWSSLSLPIQTCIVLWVCSYYETSVCLSHFLTMFLWSYHPELLPLTDVMSMQKVSVTEVKTQLSRLWTVTPFLINICWWDDAQSLMLLGRCALLFLRSSIKFEGQSYRGQNKMLILTQIGRFQTVSPVWIHPWFWNDAQSLT